MVLDDLVLHDAHARLLDGHLGQGDARLVGGQGSLIEDLVDLLLREGGELSLRLAHAGHPLLKGIDAVDELYRFCHAVTSRFAEPLGMNKNDAMR